MIAGVGQKTGRPRYSHNLSCHVWLLQGARKEYNRGMDMALSSRQVAMRRLPARRRLRCASGWRQSQIRRGGRSPSSRPGLVQQLLNEMLCLKRRGSSLHVAVVAVHPQACELQKHASMWGQHAPSEQRLNAECAVLPQYQLAKSLMCFGEHHVALVPISACRVTYVLGRAPYSVITQTHTTTSRSRIAYILVSCVVGINDDQRIWHPDEAITL